MKTLVPKLLRCRLVQVGGLLAVIAAVAASLASSQGSGASTKLEGAWVAKTDVGILSLVTYAPSDPSGRSAVMRNQMVWPREILARYGLEAVTEEIAEAVVTGVNTEVYNGIWYGLVGGRTVMIFVDHADITYVTPTEKTVAHTVDAYLATADADNDGYPDPGTTPVVTTSNTTISKRLGR
jgi:hypothetical protein